MVKRVKVRKISLEMERMEEIEEETEDVERKTNTNVQPPTSTHRLLCSGQF